MLNSQDKSNMLNQINSLRVCSDSIKEHLNAIQLLIVDNNNGRVKDSSLANELTSLTNYADSLSSSISSIEKKLM